MKKNLFILIGVAVTAIILFALFYVDSNQRHNVEFFSGSNFSGYEQTPPTAQVEVSPSIAWAKTGIGWKIFGVLFIGVMWFGLWYTNNDKHIKNGKENKGLAYAMVFGPILLSVIILFAGYSSSQNSNYESVERVRFDSWVQTGAIKQRGEKTFVDAKGSDTLKNLFTGNWIK